MLLADTTDQTPPVGEHAPVIISLSTYTGGTAGPVTVVIRGAWLESDSTVELIRTGSDPVTSLHVLGNDDGTELSATFELDDS